MSGDGGPEGTMSGDGGPEGTISGRGHRLLFLSGKRFAALSWLCDVAACVPGCGGAAPVQLVRACVVTASIACAWWSGPCCISSTCLYSTVIHCMCMAVWSLLHLQHVRVQHWHPLYVRGGLVPAASSARACTALLSIVRAWWSRPCCPSTRALLFSFFQWLRLNADHHHTSENSHCDLGVLVHVLEYKSLEDCDVPRCAQTCGQIYVSTLRLCLVGSAGGLTWYRGAASLSRSGALLVEVLDGLGFPVCHFHSSPLPLPPQHPHAAASPLLTFAPSQPHNSTLLP